MKLIDGVFNLMAWFCLKRFLVRTLHIRHVIKVLVLSIASFYQGLALAQASIPFHMNGMNGNISDNGDSNEKAKKKNPRFNF